VLYRHPYEEELMKHRWTSPIGYSLMAVAALGIAVAFPGSAGASGSGTQALIGTFKLVGGSCSGAAPTGSYFKMIFPGGTVAGGKFFDNPDSACTDKSYTLFNPGAAGGFTTGKFQRDPVPAFSATGGALSNAIIQPQLFTAIDFGIATNPKDQQTGLKVPPPSITVRKGKLSGQVTAWSAAWNKLYFNQGSPKPDGTKPGLTLPVSGTYNAKTRAFVLTWASSVVGGPFNGFTGYWHLQGTFKPSKK
jgi:hypothetical protein